MLRGGKEPRSHGVDAKNFTRQEMHNYNMSAAYIADGYVLIQSNAWDDQSIISNRICYTIIDKARSSVNWLINTFVVGYEDRVPTPLTSS